MRIHGDIAELIDFGLVFEEKIRLAAEAYLARKYNLKLEGGRPAEKSAK